MNLAEVRLWGRRIGAVRWDATRACAAFEYDPEFQESGIELSPIHMPLSPRIYEFPELARTTFRGLPGLLADSLPDRFGNALIDAWLARRGREHASFHPVERLCYVGRRAMGALEYEPAIDRPDEGQPLDVAELRDLAATILQRHDRFETNLHDRQAALRQIFLVGTSAGGARAKAVIAWNPTTQELRSGQADAAAGFEHWILKFDGVAAADGRELGDALGYGTIEYAYAQMARLAGIQMQECRLLEEGPRRHFMTRRFDRVPGGGKLHMQTLGALGHFDYDQAGAHSYEQCVEIMRRLGCEATAFEQIFRRAVFNLLARNQDDHVKNIAFLMDRAGIWSLAPAYDLTFSFNPEGPWTALHQMSLNGKRDGFLAADLLAFARHCGLKRPRTLELLGEVAAAVEQWPRIAAEAGIAEERWTAIGHLQRRLPV